MPFLALKKKKNLYYLISWKVKIKLEQVVSYEHYRRRFIKVII